MTLKTTGCLLWRLLWSNTPPGPLPVRRLAEVANRRCSSSQPAKSAKRFEFTPPAGSKHDWIGPPDRLSNLRPVIYHVPEQETELEGQLRNLRQGTENWNHEFWTNQNITFNKEKDDFIVSQLKAKGLSVHDEQGRRRALNSEEMAVFYKHFLDTNCKRHADYNKEWYRRNFTITFLMARVAVQSAWRTLTESGRRGSPTT